MMRREFIAALWGDDRVPVCGTRATSGDGLSHCISWGQHPCVSNRRLPSGTPELGYVEGQNLAIEDTCVPNGTR
jgi:hypothetical protein